jgi:predicted phage terminase large subunit-like protein
VHHGGRRSFGRLLPATQGEPLQEGLSGNPQGRPRMSRDLRADICDELAEPIEVKDESGRVLAISKQRALVKALVRKTLPRIVSVDPGHKRTPTGSPSVIQVWAPDGDRFYLLDQWRERASCSDFRSAFLDICRKHRPNIALIEDTGYGPSLIDKPPAFGWLTIVPCTPDSRSKRERLAAHLKAIRAGCINLPEGADWTDDYVEEFLTFPANCTDQVDATVQFLDKAGSAKWDGLRRPKVAIGAVALGSSPTPATPAPLSRAIGAVACASEWRR